MAKALVIKNADFSINKVATVVFNDKACTGLSVSPDTINFNSIGQTQELTLTKTPADTTDSVTYASSDTSVCTVDNGIVTCVGFGSATVTVTCGTVSATCSVGVSGVTINADWSVGDSGSTSTTGGTLLFVADEASAYIFAADSIASGSTAEVFYYEHSVYPLVIPQGATSINVTMDDFIGNTMKVAWYNSNSKPYTNSRYVNCIEGLSRETNITINANGNTLTIPNGADRLILHIQTDSQQTKYADMSAVAAEANIVITAE